METFKSFRNPLRVILNTTIWIFFVLLILYIGVRVSIVTIQERETVDLLKNIADDIKSIALSVFDFVRPFLQLVIILIILEWLLNKFGLSFSRDSLKLDWNVQTIIALIVIIAFSLAALSGVEGASMLKDVALVVVGFYFGTKKRSQEITYGDSKITTIEENINERGMSK